MRLPRPAFPRARAAAAYLALTFADLVTTLAAIRWLGATEANPVMAPIVAVPILFAVLKVSLAAFIAYRFATRSHKAVVYFGLAVTTVVVWSNSVLITGTLLWG